jgi:hypothetical protein
MYLIRFHGIKEILSITCYRKKFIEKHGFKLDSWRYEARPWRASILSKNVGEAVVKRFFSWLSDLCFRPYCSYEGVNSSWIELLYTINFWFLEDICFWLIYTILLEVYLKETKIIKYTRDCCGYILLKSVFPKDTLKPRPKPIRNPKLDENQYFRDKTTTKPIL